MKQTPSPLDALDSMHSECEKWREECAQGLQTHVARITDGEVETYVQKRLVFLRIDKVLQQIQYKVQCSVCGRPAEFECAMSVVYRDGIFQFVHPENDNVPPHGISETLPSKLVFVPDPKTVPTCRPQFDFPDRALRQDTEMQTSPALLLEIRRGRTRSCWQDVPELDDEDALEQQANEFALNGTDQR